MLLSRYVKGVPSFSGRYTKGVSFLSKTVSKRVRGWTLGRSLPIRKFVGCPPPGIHVAGICHGKARNLLTFNGKLSPRRVPTTSLRVLSAHLTQLRQSLLTVLGHCVGAFDLLNTCIWGSEKNWLFSEGKRGFRQFLKGCTCRHF